MENKIYTVKMVFPAVIITIYSSLNQHYKISRSHNFDEVKLSLYS